MSLPHAVNIATLTMDMLWFFNVIGSSRSMVTSEVRSQK